ncbi:hypothetical protein ACWGDX_26530 [Streptomyces sp. NPDC055025]
MTSNSIKLPRRADGPVAASAEPGPPVQSEGPRRISPRLRPSWAEIPDAASHLPGPAFLVAFVPDEDPDLEPTVHIHSHDEHVVPYEIMVWFMEQVTDQVQRCRAAPVEGDSEAVG